MSKKRRVNVTVSEELYNWCNERAEEYGLSVPALFVVAMAQYKEQSTAMNEMPLLLKKLQEIELNGQNNV